MLHSANGKLPSRVFFRNNPPPPSEQILGIRIVEDGERNPLNYAYSNKPECKK